MICASFLKLAQWFWRSLKWKKKFLDKRWSLIGKRCEISPSPKNSKWNSLQFLERVKNLKTMNEGKVLIRKNLLEYLCCIWTTKEKNQTIFGAFKILFQKINYTSKWFWFHWLIEIKFHPIVTKYQPLHQIIIYRQFFKDSPLAIRICFTCISNMNSDQLSNFHWKC